MRLLVLVAFLLAAHTITGQTLLTKTVTVSFKEQSLEKCLEKLSQVSGVDFSYNSKQISEVEKKVSATFKDESLETILSALFQNTNLAFKEIGGQITIYETAKAAEVTTLSGYVRNAKSKEEIVGAKIYFPELKTGCHTNLYGYYSIEVPTGLIQYTVSSMGMKNFEGSADIRESLVLNFLLEENSIVLNTVAVTSVSDSLEEKTETVDLSNSDKTTITRGSVLRLPAANGELDLIKYIQQFPGVQASNDGGANFQVRGSGTGNNLILMDEIPIYHPTHMLGVYSILNMDAVKSAELYKDYIPSRYGSRNASVLQVQTKEGDLEKYHFTGGVSFVSARANLEGPIVKNKSSFYFSVRKSLFPGVASNLLNSSNFVSYPSYYDLNAKMNYHLNSNNRIYLTGYMGQDKLRDTSSLYKWGNLAGAIRWNHIFNSKTFSNLNITHSEFNYLYGNNFSVKENIYGQKVVTDKINYNITHFYNNDMRFDYGAEIAWIRTRKGNRSDQTTDLFMDRNAFENAFYGSAEKKISSRWNLKAGLRLPFSFHIGTQDTTTYLQSDFSKITVVYQKNKLYDFMFFLDPRILLTYLPSENDRLQFSVNLASQHTHIVNYINYFLPIEIWTTSNSFLKPERSFSESVGWIHHHSLFESSVTIFNRNVINILDYASPSYTGSQDIESNLLAGKLHAYGVEFQLNFSKSDRYAAVVSYTFMQTRQTIEGINNNQPYVANNDRPHYFSFSQYLVANTKWQIGTNLIIHSGTATTLPNGQFTINGTTFPLFPIARNAERLPVFGRLDLSFTRKLGIKKKRDRYILVFTFTNFLNRNNPSVVYVDKKTFASNSFEVKSVNYAPFSISINLNYTF